MYNYNYQTQVKRGFAAKNRSKKRKQEMFPNPNLIPITNRFQRLARMDVKGDNFVSPGRSKLRFNVEASSPNVRDSRSSYSRKYSTTDKTPRSHDKDRRPIPDHRSKGSYDMRSKGPQTLSNVHKVVKYVTRTQDGCKSTLTPRHHQMQGHTSSNSSKSKHNTAWSNVALKSGTTSLRREVRDFRKRKKAPERFRGFRGRKFDMDKVKINLTVEVSTSGERKVTGRVRTRSHSKREEKSNIRIRDRARSLERWKLSSEKQEKTESKESSDAILSAKKRQRQNSDEEDYTRRRKAPRDDAEEWTNERMERRREKHRRRREKVKERKNALLKKMRKVKTTNRIKKRSIKRGKKRKQQVETAQQGSPGSPGSTGSQPCSQPDRSPREESRASCVRSSAKKARVESYSQSYTVISREVCAEILRDLLDKMSGREKSPREAVSDDSSDEDKMQIDLDQEEEQSAGSGDESKKGEDRERTSSDSVFCRSTRSLPSPVETNWDLHRLSEERQGGGPRHLCELCGEYSSSDGELKNHVEDQHSWFIKWRRLRHESLPVNVARAINWDRKIESMQEEEGLSYVAEIGAWIRIVNTTRENLEAADLSLLDLDNFESLPSPAKQVYKGSSQVAVDHSRNEVSALRSPPGEVVGEVLITGISGTGTGEDDNIMNHLVDNIKREEISQPLGAQTSETIQEEHGGPSGSGSSGSGSGYDPRVHYRDGNGVAYSHKVVKSSLDRGDSSLWDALLMSERLKYIDNEKEFKEEEKMKKMADDMFYSSQSQTQTQSVSPNLLEDINQGGGSGASQLPSESILDMMDVTDSPKDGQDGLQLNTVTETQAMEMRERRERDAKHEADLFATINSEEMENELQERTDPAGNVDPPLAPPGTSAGGLKRGRTSSGSTGTPPKPAAKASRKIGVTATRGKGSATAARPTRTTRSSTSQGSGGSLIITKRGGASRGGGNTARRGGGAAASGVNNRKVPDSVSTSASPVLSSNTGLGSLGGDSQGGASASIPSASTPKPKSSPGTSSGSGSDITPPDKLTKKKVEIWWKKCKEKIEKEKAKLKEAKAKEKEAIEKAKEFKKYWTTAEENVTGIMAERNMARDDRDESLRRNEEQAKIIETTKEKLRNAELKCNEKQAKIVGLRADNAKLKDEVSSLQRNLKIEQGKVGLEKRRGDDLSKKLQKASTSASDNNQGALAQSAQVKKINELKEKVNQLRKEHEDQEEKRLKEIENLNKTIAERNIQVGTYEAMADKSRNENDEMSETLVKRERKVAKLTRDIKKANEDLEKLQDKVAEQSTTIEGLQQDRARINEQVTNGLTGRNTARNSVNTICTSQQCEKKKALDNIAKIGSGPPPAPLVTERDRFFAEERQKRKEAEEEKRKLAEEVTKLKEEAKKTQIMLSEACKENLHVRNALEIVEAERDSAQDMVKDNKMKIVRLRSSLDEHRNDNEIELRDIESRNRNLRDEIKKLKEEVKELKTCGSKVGSQMLMDNIENKEKEIERLQRSLEHSDNMLTNIRRDNQTLMKKLAEARARIPCSTKGCLGYTYGEDGQETKCMYAPPHGKGGILGKGPGSFPSQDRRDFPSQDRRDKMGTYCPKCPHCKSFPSQDRRQQDNYCSSCPHCNPSKEEVLRRKEKERKEEEERKSRKEATLYIPRSGEGSSRTLSSGRQVGSQTRESTLRLRRPASTPPSGGLAEKLKGRALSKYDSTRKLPGNFDPDKVCKFWETGNCSQRDKCRYTHPDTPSASEEEDFSHLVEDDEEIEEIEVVDDIMGDEFEDEEDGDNEVFEEERKVMEISSPETPRVERRSSPSPVRSRTKSKPRKDEKTGRSVSFSRSSTVKTISTDEDGLDREARRSHRDESDRSRRESRRDSRERWSREPLGRRESRSERSPSRGSHSRKRTREDDDNHDRQRSKSQKRSERSDQIEVTKVRPKLKSKVVKKEEKRVEQQGNEDRVPVSGAGAQKEEKRSQRQMKEEIHASVRGGTSTTLQRRLLQIVEDENNRLSTAKNKRKSRSRSVSRSTANSSRNSSRGGSRSRTRSRSLTRSQTRSRSVSRSRTRSPMISPRRGRRSPNRRSRTSRRSPTVDKGERSKSRSVSRSAGGESSPATSPRRSWKAERTDPRPSTSGRRESSRRDSSRKKERSPSPPNPSSKGRGRGRGRKGGDRK